MCGGGLICLVIWDDFTFPISGLTHSERLRGLSKEGREWVASARPARAEASGWRAKESERLELGNEGMDVGG